MPEIAQETILKAADGNVEAFEIIYNEYFSFVSNVALRVVNRVEDAEEIAQEVFLTIYQKLKMFRFESSLKTWIYRMTINTAINYAKKVSRHRKQRVEFTDALDIHDESSTIKDKLNEEYYEKLITDLLDMLNPDQRACIVLRSIEGMNYQEIAHVLNIPVNTVRSRIKRARETMMVHKNEVIKNAM